MNLDEFISESLMQILQGIRTAQQNTNEMGPGIGIINPKWGTAPDHATYISEVGFDIAISAVDQQTGGGKAGLKVLSVEVGGARETSTERSSVSRVSFRLPVSFPAVTVTDVPPRDE